MSNVTRDVDPIPTRDSEDGITDPGVVKFRANFESRSPLDELIRKGARRMLQAAIDAVVDDFLAEHSGRRDEQGRRLIVRNGSLPEREILTGAGKLPVRQPRVRDQSSGDDRVWFSPQVLPLYLKRTNSELLSNIDGVAKRG